ncbi:MAG: hypothetical protein H7Y06_04670 [Opitutaceae bacterium]|nr:hypothetical protein [Opitutaceae bacterium]
MWARQLNSGFGSDPLFTNSRRWQRFLREARTGVRSVRWYAGESEDRQLHGAFAHLITGQPEFAEVSRADFLAIEKMWEAETGEELAEPPPLRETCSRCSTRFWSMDGSEAAEASKVLSSDDLFSDEVAGDRDEHDVDDNSDQ